MEAHDGRWSGSTNPEVVARDHLPNECRSGPRHRPGPGRVLLVWCVLAIGALVGLHHLGHGLLAAPPITHPGRIAAWAASRGPVTVGFALARVTAEVVTAYLLATTLGGAGARAARLATAARVLDKLSVEVLRRLVATVASLSLATAATGTASSTVAWAASPARAAAEPGTGGADWAVPLMRVVGGASPTQLPAPALPTRPAPALPTWTVAPGDNLWTIAAATLRRQSDRQPTEGEVDAYWQRLIVANRARLADPDTPDLIFAGQVFVLPAP